MRRVKLSRYVVAVFSVGLLALAGFVLSRPKHALAQEQDSDHRGFTLDDVEGRYVSAENAYDISSVHSFSAAANSSNVGPPINFVTAEVMKADGKGNVCGEADGFYSLGTNGATPAANTGPSLFHGTYTVEAATGRVTINTCNDGAPSTTNTFCGTSTACAPSIANKIQVGYLQSREARVVTTVEQTTGPGTDQDVNGFLVHKRVWTRKSGED